MNLFSEFNVILTGQRDKSIYSVCLVNIEVRTNFKIGYRLAIEL